MSGTCGIGIWEMLDPRHDGKDEMNREHRKMPGTIKTPQKVWTTSQFKLHVIY